MVYFIVESEIDVGDWVGLVYDLLGRLNLLLWIGVGGWFVLLGGNSRCVKERCCLVFVFVVYIWRKYV